MFPVEFRQVEFFLDPLKRGVPDGSVGAKRHQPFASRLDGSAHYVGVGALRPVIAGDGVCVILLRPLQLELIPMPDE